MVGLLVTIFYADDIALEESKGDQCTETADIAVVKGSRLNVKRSMFLSVKEYTVSVVDGPVEVIESWLDATGPGQKP
ncbi:unnamed protein product [Haemonchus placei]|uniref:Reverse transcriptase domain-containing protein n=1 Tax=Haemonchus placei TaxID=6290 RepID=A0A0N4WM50_HAEPC|nr:unnamed protein product [Haemonchus placei]